MIIVLELRKFKEKFQFCSKLIENFFDLNFFSLNFEKRMRICKIFFLIFLKYLHCCTITGRLIIDPNWLVARHWTWWDINMGMRVLIALAYSICGGIWLKLFDTGMLFSDCIGPNVDSSPPTVNVWPSLRTLIYAFSGPQYCCAYWSSTLSPTGTVILSTRQRMFGFG